MICPDCGTELYERRGTSGYFLPDYFCHSCKQRRTYLDVVNKAFSRFAEMKLREHGIDPDDIPEIKSPNS